MGSGGNRRMVCDRRQIKARWPKPFYNNLLEWSLPDITCCTGTSTDKIKKVLKVNWIDPTCKNAQKTMDQPNFSNNAIVHKFHDFFGAPVKTVTLGEFGFNSKNSKTILGSTKNQFSLTTVPDKKITVVKKKNFFDKIDDFNNNDDVVPVPDNKATTRNCTNTADDELYYNVIQELDLLLYKKEHDTGIPHGNDTDGSYILFEDGNKSSSIDGNKSPYTDSTDQVDALENSTSDSVSQTPFPINCKIFEKWYKTPLESLLHQWTL